MWQPKNKVKGENTVISTVFSPDFGGLKNGGIGKMFVYRQMAVEGDKTDGFADGLENCCRHSSYMKDAGGVAI